MDLKSAKIANLKISWNKAATPCYVTQPEESFEPQDWAMITVTYDNQNDWVDELEFRYFVAVFNQQTKTYLLLNDKSTYVDINKGSHANTVFFSPNTLKRYGEVRQAAVEIHVDNTLIAAASTTNSGTPWWRTANVKNVSGKLLNREQTPFRFIAADQYDTLKPGAEKK